LIAGIALPTMKSVSRIYESSWLTQRNGYIPKHYHAQGDVTIMHRDVILLSEGEEKGKLGSCAKAFHLSSVSRGYSTNL